MHVYLHILQFAEALCTLMIFTRKMGMTFTSVALDVLYLHILYLHILNWLYILYLDITGYDFFFTLIFYLQQAD
jgi:hypothetical protein